MVLNQSFGGMVAPGGCQSLSHCPNVRLVELDDRATLATPGSVGGVERIFFRLDERRLLVRGQLAHSPSFLRPEGREDLAAHPEIGMTHVRLLGGFRQA